MIELAQKVLNAEVKDEDMYAERNRLMEQAGLVGKKRSSASAAPKAEALPKKKPKPDGDGDAAVSWGLPPDFGDVFGI